MAHKRISSLYFMADSKDDLTHLLESQMGTTCFVIEDACEYKRTSDGRWIPQTASSIASLATEEYVDEAIANIEHPLPEVDKAHQVLTTNENGEKIWEDKLYYNYRVDYEVYAETIIPEGKSRIMPSIDVIEPIIKNESYIVTWDGVEYPCLAYAREGSDLGTVLGNEYFAYPD